MLFHRETSKGVVRLPIAVRFESGVTLFLRSVNSHHMGESFRFSFKIVANVSKVLFLYSLLDEMPVCISTFAFT